MPKATKRRAANESSDESNEEKMTKTKMIKKDHESNHEENLKSKYDLVWKEYGEMTTKKVRPVYYLSSNKASGSDKIAAFDIDNTIIVTKSGKNFAIDAKDWKWFDKTVPIKLKELNDKGFRIVFFTNQAGIEKGNVKFSELKTKFQDIISQLDNVPVFIFISTGESHYRKPCTEMWTFFVEQCNQSVKVNMDESFYVGDAAGRPKNWAVGKKKDFSCSDRKFASNIKLKFYTPEEFFLGEKPVEFEWDSINPNEFLKTTTNLTKDSKQINHKDEQEMVLFIGPPASGKSTLVTKYFVPHNYVRVNRDTLLTQEKCLKAAEEALKQGKSVCVDNTNPSKSTRAEYIHLAKKYKLKSIRCFKMKTPLELCHHLNFVRQTRTKGQTRRIPDIGYNMYKKNYEEPDKSEGFTEIKEIDFVADFESDDHERIFKQWS